MNINQRIRVFLRAFNSTFEFRTGEMKKKKKRLGQFPISLISLTNEHAEKLL